MPWPRAGATSRPWAAPLRRVDIDDPRPTDLLAVRGVAYTPTFVLLNEGAEVGRILSYGGEEHFWGLLGVWLREVTPSPSS